MRPRSILAPVLAMLVLACGASAALGFGAGATFLTGGLDLPAGAIAGGQSGYSGGEADRSSISADGRWVAFVSEADTLDPAAHPDVSNVFRKDRVTGEVVLVSRATGVGGATFPLSSASPAISDDGTRVAFSTRAALDPADTDGGAADVYVRDVLAGTTTLATPSTTTGLGGFDLSGDGRFVVFATEDGLALADLGVVRMDVYRRDLTLARTELVSINALGTRAGDGASFDPSVSDDGVWVAFASGATDLASPYTPGSGNQIFARDMTARRTYLVSARSSSTTTGANAAASEPDVAGRPATLRPDQVVVAYESRASDIHADDASGDASVFRRLLSDARSTLVSRADGAAGANADSRAHTPSISDDGARIAFSTDATNLGAGDDYYGVYLRSVTDARTLLASASNAYAVQSALADNGAYVTWFENGATADSDPDLGGVFGRTYAAPSTLGAVELVSRPPGTAPFLATWIAVAAPQTGARTVSADGRYVAFQAYTSRLPGGSVDGTQIYRRDLLTGAIELVSRATGAAGAPAGAYVADPTISADGTRVAFVSYASFDAAHADASGQVYVRDLAAATTTLASRADGAGGALPNDDASYPAISPDGAHVAFATSATNLGVPGTDQHVYLRDLATGATQLVDRADGAAGAPGNDNAELPSLSTDGRFVAFGSQASNLDADDPDTFADIYVRDTVTGATTLVSRRSGLAGAHAASTSYYPSISADGRVVAFEASDETLATEAGGWGGRKQIVARTLATGANVLVSRAPGGAPADADASSPSVSGEGSVVAFESLATNLLAGVGGGTRHGVFARTMATGALAGPPAFGLMSNDPQNRAFRPAISDDGQCLAFVARGHNAITGTAGDDYTSYMHVVSGVCPKPLVPVAAPRATPRPRLTSVSLSRKRFRVGKRPTATAAARSAARRKRRPPVGTTFRFTLDTRANVAIAIERQAQGRLVGRFCRKPSRRLRRNLRCVRFVRVGRLSRGGMNAGANRIAFSGRIGRRALRPGRYRARLRASNAGGVSSWVKLSFTVVRR
jgi:Tol biopolymer transport system component